MADIVVAPISTQISRGKRYEIPNRRIYVQLINGVQSASGYESVKDINFYGNNSETIVRFSRTFGGLGKADITLYNLHPQTINEFTQTSYLPRVPNRIRIYAGYEEPEKGGIGLLLGNPIYEGYILWAAPVGITDIALQIEAMEEFPELNYDISLSPSDGGNPEDTDSTEIIDAVLEHAGFRTNYEALYPLADITPYVHPKGVDFVNYSFSGKIADFLQKEIFRFNRMQFIIEGKTVFLRPNSEDENLILTQTKLPIDHFISGRLQEDIDGVEGVKSAFDTLMIGSPSVSYYGANIRVLYTKNLKAGDRFKLISRLYPKFNFVYEIINIKYDLQLRGQNFYMDLECIRSRNSK